VTLHDGPRTGASGLIICKEHTGTHIDALCHQAEDGFLCGGIKADASVMHSKGFNVHGVENIPPIVAPGVLLDMAAHFGVDSVPEGYAISAGELQACARVADVARQRELPSLFDLRTGDTGPSARLRDLEDRIRQQRRLADACLRPGYFEPCCRQFSVFQQRPAYQIARRISAVRRKFGRHLNGSSRARSRRLRPHLCHNEGERDQ